MISTESFFNVRIFTFKHTTSKAAFYPTKNILRHIQFAFLLEFYWLLPLAFDGGDMNQYISCGIFAIFLITLYIMYPKAHGGFIFFDSIDPTTTDTALVRKLLETMRGLDDTILKVLLASGILAIFTSIISQDPGPTELFLGFLQIFVLLRASSLTWLTIPSEFEVRFHETIEENRDI